ncbi:MAG: hypothetical protein LBC53_10100 [Spirochaetaceae bacterium]|jgi:hypothetical protein|nr:hypothetical protein [Spirochaetaceae bacterium]
MRFVLSLFLLGAVFSSCSQTEFDGEKAVSPAGNCGILRLNLTVKDETRNVFPSFDRYEAVLTSAAGVEIERNLTQPPFLVEAPAGIYSLVVKAFAGEETLAAAGSADVTINAGETSSATVPLVLALEMGEGAGSLSYNIKFPKDAVEAVLTIKELKNANNAQTLDFVTSLASGSVSGLVTGKPAGFYLLTLSIKRGGHPFVEQTAVKTVLAHIYPSLKTAFTEDAGSFPAAYSFKPGLYFDFGRRITDADFPSNQAEWEAQNTYFVEAGKPVVLAPVTANPPENAVYEWQLGGVVEAGATNPILTKQFTATSTLVKAVMKIDAVTSASASLLVKAVPLAPYRPKTEASKSKAAVCVEFTSAPGQFVGVGNGYSNPSIANLAQKTEASVKNIIQDYMDGKTPFNNSSVDGEVFSLGGWGGYFTVKFDHSVHNLEDDDLEILSNYNVAGMAEAGVVWVSCDVNGDGEPNEIWYRLKGSLAGERPRHAVSYFKPRANSKPSAFWMDNKGLNGSFIYFSNVNDGYPYYITGNAGTFVTFTGVFLEDGNLSGYVDAGATRFDISDAVDDSGAPVSLEYIDFVKVQTGLNKDGGGLGEYSCESGVARDLHF